MIFQTGSQGPGSFALGQVFALGPFDHQRARHGPRERRRVEAVIHQALRDVFGGKQNSLRKSQPVFQRGLNLLQQCWLQNAKPSFQLHGWNSADALRVECSWFEPASLMRNFKTSATRMQSARNVTDHGPLVIKVVNAEDNTRTGFLRHSQIHHPNLAPFSSWHSGVPLRRTSRTFLPRR